jgi:hypothetical protein
MRFFRSRKKKVVQEDPQLMDFYSTLKRGSTKK